jgi:adenylate cyclase
MAVEIERKFLVSDPSWKTGNGSLLRQGYLSKTPERTVRVRLADDAAWLTIKGITTGTSRAEFEYRIPCADAAELLKLCDGPLLEKTRYRVEYRGHIWEVDEFHGDNEGLVVAEVELQQENESVELPPWIGDEVTNDVRYFNSNLARQPFRSWPRA